MSGEGWGDDDGFFGGCSTRPIKNIKLMLVRVCKNKTVISFSKFFWFGNILSACFLNFFRSFVHLVSALRRESE
jgi:hypothetical protein